VGNIRAIWRLIGLSEIPFSNRLEFTKEIVEFIFKVAFTEEGFSLTGNRDGIFPCYNAIICSSLCRLNLFDVRVKAGINWILNFQKFERNRETEWNGKGIQKYGGCLRSTPCYIGVVKSVDALTQFKRVAASYRNVDEKLNLGLEYMLNQRLFKKLTDSTPITKDIVKLTYPFSYKINIVEILRIIKENDLLLDDRCFDAIQFITSKIKHDGTWHINNVYASNGWIEFDKKKEPAYWITNEIDQIGLRMK